jgi:polyhydroxybutyrate depolymerase
MRKFIASILLFALNFVPAAAQQVAPGTDPRDPQAAARAAAARTPIPEGGILRTMQVGGLERSFWFVRPASVKAPAPVVFVLHGGNVSDGRVTFRYGFQDLGARDGVITVHPSGYGEGWNDGRDTPFLLARGGADDVAFFRAMIDLLIAEGAADPKRIFITGGSNGGMMTHRLVCDLSDRIAGAAPFVAWIPAPVATRCETRRPVPILLMGGTADRLMPFPGGQVAPMSRDDRGRVMSAEQTFSFWRARNRCGDQVVRQELPDADPADGTRIAVSRGQGCAAPVELYVVDGGGHRRPGEGARTYGDQGMAALSGVSSRDIDGKSVIWEFFKLKDH